MSCRGFEPVCTNNELREYFSAKGLTYDSIDEVYGYGERTARRWITELTNILSVYLFGADAIVLD